MCLLYKEEIKTITTTYTIDNGVWIGVAHNPNQIDILPISKALQIPFTIYNKHSLNTSFFKTVHQPRVRVNK